MFKTARKFIVFFVSIHLLLVITMVSYRLVYGQWVNDQSPIFLVNLAVYYMNLPSVLLLKSLRQMGNNPGWIPIFLMGIVQWSIVAIIIGSIYYQFKSKASSDSFKKK